MNVAQGKYSGSCCEFWIESNSDDFRYLLIDHHPLAGDLKNIVVEYIIVK